MATRAAEVEEGDGKVLTTAIARIAEFWGLTNAKLGSVLGLSQATVSRLRSGRSELDPASKSFEAGQFLLRLFRSLDALLATSKHWRLPNGARCTATSISISSRTMIWDTSRSTRATTTPCRRT